MDVFFFFQAEDGIRDDLVTGVQTCALPILKITEPATIRMLWPEIVIGPSSNSARVIGSLRKPSGPKHNSASPDMAKGTAPAMRSRPRTDAPPSGRNGSRHCRPGMGGGKTKVSAKQ